MSGEFPGCESSHPLLAMHAKLDSADDLGADCGTREAPLLNLVGGRVSKVTSWTLHGVGPSGLLW